jgi:hypothetical protein
MYNPSGGKGCKDIAPYKGKRRKLLDYLVNIDNSDQDITDICKATGISRTTYYKYVHEPEFHDALKLCVTDLYAKSAPQVANSMIRQAKKGNVRAGVLIHDALGLTGNKQGPSQVVNVVNNEVTTDQPYESTAEALAMIDSEIELLQAQRQAIALQASDTGTGTSTNRIGDHAIHPDKATGEGGEV